MKGERVSQQREGRSSLVAVADTEREYDERRTSTVVRRRHYSQQTTESRINARWMQQSRNRDGGGATVEGGWEDDGVKLPRSARASWRERKDAPPAPTRGESGSEWDCKGARRQGGQAASYPTSGTKYKAWPGINPLGQAVKSIGKERRDSTGAG